MEIADIFAIIGWALLGFCLPTHLAVFRDGASVFGDNKAQLSYWIYSGISFALIAASVVLGN